MVPVDASHPQGAAATTGSRGWAPVVTHRGPAAELHALEVPAGVNRQVWILESTRPAIVLGSTQPAEDVDHDAAAEAGVDVVRRRSGGGAVWVAPGDPIWIDVVIPRDDPIWSDDVGTSFVPVGRAWLKALVGLDRFGANGDAAGLAVHQGPMIHSPWSRSVCFAGVGPGEVVRADAASPTGVAKLVGISQRRSRVGARFQCAIPRQWDPGALGSVLAEPPPPGVLTAIGAGVGDVDAMALVERFMVALG